jgi:hypothetical protein
MDGMRGLLVAYLLIVLVAVLLLLTVAFTACRRSRADRRADRDAQAVPPPRPPHAAASQPPPPPPVNLSGQPSPSTSPPPLVASVGNAELRRWAKASGLRVADRGPIPAHVRAAWSNAHADDGLLRGG